MVTETTHCEQIHFAKINVNEIFYHLDFKAFGKSFDPLGRVGYLGKIASLLAKVQQNETWKVKLLFYPTNQIPLWQMYYFISSAKAWNGKTHNLNKFILQKRKNNRKDSSLNKAYL